MASEDSTAAETQFSEIRPSMLGRYHRAKDDEQKPTFPKNKKA